LPWAKHGARFGWLRSIRRPPGEVLDDAIQQVADAVGVFSGDLEHEIKAEGIKVQDAARPLVVGLVDGEQRRNVGLANHLGDLAVARYQPFTAIYNQHKKIRGVNRPAAALENELVQRVLTCPEHASRVHEFELGAVPLRCLGNHVPGRPGNRRHDGPTGVADAVEECGLPDIRATDEYD
jgi:hypothetical protein